MSDWISPHFRQDHFREPLTLESKIALFADRVRGWQLDIAQSLATSQHAGFAILSIIMSYFEMFAKYEAGYTRSNGSKSYFKKAARSVLSPHVIPAGSPLADQLLDLLYDEVRCGMYHAGITGTRIRLIGGDTPAIEVAPDRLTLNPHQLVAILQDHFSRYEERLHDPSNEELRRKFEMRFDAAHTGKHLGR